MARVTGEGFVMCAIFDTAPAVEYGSVHSLKYILVLPLAPVFDTYEFYAYGFGHFPSSKIASLGIQNPFTTCAKRLRAVDSVLLFESRGGKSDFLLVGQSVAVALDLEHSIGTDCADRSEAWLRGTLHEEASASIRLESRCASPLGRDLSQLLEMCSARTDRSLSPCWHLRATTRQAT